MSVPSRAIVMAALFLASSDLARAQDAPAPPDPALQAAVEGDRRNPRFLAFDASRHPVDELTQLALLLGGFHYFWTRLQRDPVPKLYPQYVTVALTFADIILDALVPLALILMSGVYAADYYGELARTWGAGLKSDQYTGAGLLWFLGDVAGVPFLLLSMQQFWRRDQAEAAVIDVELDRAYATRPPGAPADWAPRDEARSGQTTATERTRPWWYDDPAIRAHLRLPAAEDPDD